MDKKITITVALCASICIWLVALFHWSGNTADIQLAGRSVFGWMESRWSDYGGTYSHCYLIPFVSLYALWLRRDLLRNAVRKTCPPAVGLIVGALLLHVIGARCQLPRLSVVAFIGLLWSIPLYLWGWKVARALIFPCAYLLFCIPMNFLDGMAMKLRLLMTVLSSGVLNGLGIEIIRNGTSLISTVGEGFRLEVADPCSGLRSFLALTSLTAAYAFLGSGGLLRKWFLFALAAPIAIIGNMFRIVVLGVVSATWGIAHVEPVHDASGYIVFIVAVTCLVGVSAGLNINWTERIARWKSSITRPSSSSTSS